MKNLFLPVVVCILLLFACNGYCDIAFVANVDGNWELFIADDNGGNAIRLTETAYDEKTPSWSFDKRKIVYATTDHQLNIVNVESKEIQQVAKTKVRTPKICPCFSPDGKKIAFAQFRPVEEGDDTDLMIYNLETKETMRILDQPSIQWWPSWSPDGSRIVYVNSHCSGDCGQLIQELWIADPHGGWARQLLMTNSLCQEPDWSPDRKKIAFSSDKNGNFDIWVLSLEDWKLEQITKYGGLDVKPAWSADGKKLAFVSMRSGMMEIWIKNLKSGKVNRLRPFGDRDVACKDVAW